MVVTVRDNGQCIDRDDSDDGVDEVLITISIY